MPCVYFISDGELTKIGFTDNLPQDRLKELQTANGRKLCLIGAILGDQETEQFLHKKFSVYRRAGEWFDLPAEVLEMIKEMPMYNKNTLTLIAQEFYGFNYLKIEQKLPECIIERQQQFIKENDSVYQFFEHCVDFVREGYELGSFLYKVYSLFDESCQKYRKTEKALAMQIKPFLLKRGVDYRQTIFNKKKGRFYVGIRLKSFEEIEDYLHFKTQEEKFMFESEFKRRV